MVTSRAPRTQRVTLREVAAVAGVDPSAVSRIVNNDPRLSVSETTRKRVLAAVEELGYRPSFGARGLRTSKTSTIGFVLPNLSNPMYEPILKGVERAAEEHGYVIILGTHVEGRSARTFARLLQEGRVDGLLVASSMLHDDFIREIVEHGPGPVIPVNRRVEGVVSSVVVDDEGASRKAVDYLCGLGHRTIGGIFGPAQFDTAIRRKKGFVDAIERADVRSVKVDCAEWSAKEGYAGALDILDKHPEVTAIYASTLLMGIGALRAAAEKGRPIPSSLSVIGLHDSSLAEYLTPPLTTLRLPMEELGIAAVNLLIDCTKGSLGRPIMIKGDGQVIERASTGPAPTRA
jgi:LacI family transcriptional regulator